MLCPLPAIATKSELTLAELIAGNDWYLAATDSARLAYRDSRLRVIKEGTADLVTLRSSGSTGRRKLYKWGPCFDIVDAFFYHLVKDGLDALPVCQVIVSNFKLDGSANTFALKSFGDPQVSEIAFVELGGRGPIPGLARALADKHLQFSPVSCSFLSQYSPLFQELSPCALLLTGEQLAPTLAEHLRSLGFDVRDFMRCWDGGATFYTCRFGGKHWVPFLADLSLNDGNCLIATDLYNAAQPHCDYWNGDILERNEAVNMCRCGQLAYDVVFRNRTDTAYFELSSGRILTYEYLLGCLRYCLRLEDVDDTKLIAACFGLELSSGHLELAYITTDVNFDILQKVEVRLEVMLQLGPISVRREIKPTVTKLKKMYWIEHE